MPFPRPPLVGKLVWCRTRFTFWSLCGACASLPPLSHSLATNAGCLSISGVHVEGVRTFERGTQGRYPNDDAHRALWAWP